MKTANQTEIYEYTTCTPVTYVPLERRQAHDLQFYRKLGITGWGEEAAFPDAKFVSPRKGDFEKKEYFSMNWQWLYVTSKLLWDPNLDVNKLLADVESKYYGKAYPAMKKYHDLRRKLWENAIPCLGYPTGDQRQATLLLVPGSKEELLALLAEAKKLAAEDKKLLYRIGKDEKFLSLFWIKPNEKAKENQTRAFHAPVINAPICIDGKGDENAWASACYSADFKKTGTLQAIPPALATSAGILSDGKNLYFLFRCFEPNIGGLKDSGGKDAELWGNDSIEIFLHPRDETQNYAHIVINTKGKVYDARCPGNEKQVDFGVEAAATRDSKSFTIEVKVPIAKIGRYEEGMFWGVHFARNRFAGSVNGESYSLNGHYYHDPSQYQCLVLGETLIPNGSFEEIRNGKAKYWDTFGSASLVKEGNSYAMHLAKPLDRCFMGLFGKLGQSSKPRSISATFKAKGTGTLQVSFYRYTDTPDSKAKHGYTRVNKPSATVGKFKLGKEYQTYTVKRTIPANEWNALGFMSLAGEVTVDDVSVTLEN